MASSRIDDEASSSSANAKNTRQRVTNKTRQQQERNQHSRLLQPFFHPSSPLSKVQRFHISPTQDMVDNEADPIVKVIIKYKNDNGRAFAEGKARAYRAGPGLQKLGALSAAVHNSTLTDLDADPNIEYWEHDQYLRPMTITDPKVFMWNMQLIQANDPSEANSSGYVYSTASTESAMPPAPYPLTMSSPCSDPNTFKIGIVDSGTDVRHPDLPCWNFSDPSTNCIGEPFGLMSDETWYQPTDVHGTHVMGIISALGLGIGVHGVNQDRTICYISARIFGRLEQADTSSMIEAVTWLASIGVNVINMSLGGGGFMQTAADLFSSLQKQGIMSIAAAGNNGLTEYGTPQPGYPASYPGVISVAAVDDTETHANYSTYNSDVALSAPGTAILSTAPLGMASIALVEEDGKVRLGSFMANSVLPGNNETISGILQYCPDYGASTCWGAGGHICLIQRGGGILFENKGLSCQRGGGIAAIVYNNVPGLLAGGTLATPTNVTIPVMGISQEDGAILLATRLGTSVNIGNKDGYAILDGTSMACPHVSGTAGLIWSRCRNCTGAQVTQCMETTAKDLGPPGRDVYYGYGLVQVAAAHKCLIHNAQCCAQPFGSAAQAAFELATSAPTNLNDAQTEANSALTTTVPGQTPATTEMTTAPIDSSVAPTLSPTATPSIAHKRNSTLVTGASTSQYNHANNFVAAPSSPIVGSSSALSIVSCAGIILSLLSTLCAFALW